MTAIDERRTTPADPAFDGRGPASALMRERMKRLPRQNIADIARWGFDRDDVIPLWFGEGDLATPPFICDAASRAMAEGKTFYTHQRGIPALRSALSGYMSSLYRTEIGVDRITVTSGGMAGILLAVQTVLDAGDNIVVIEPVWPNIQGAIALMGGEKRSVAMDSTDEGWRLDLDRLAAACDSRTRAIFFASPGNPTGWIMPPEQQRDLLAFARRRDIWLVADEVYARFVYDREAAPSMLEHARPEDPVFVVNSFSKSWAMTGWRVGWLTAPPSVGETLAQMVQYNTSGTATFVQEAAVTAVAEGEWFVQEMRERCRRGREIVCGTLAQMPKVRLRAWPPGAMYAYFEVEGMTDSIARCGEIFQRTAVGLAPGFAFGSDSESHLRICFCYSAHVLEEAMRRLAPEFA